VELLLTVPGISHIAQDQWSKYWLWSFTDASMQRIMQEHFSEENITIKTYGNVLVASAFYTEWVCQKKRTSRLL
jgi:hypothetical protein